MIRGIFMLFLTALIIAVFIAFCLDKPMKKHPAVFYLTAAVLTAGSIIVMQSGIEISSSFVREYVIGILSRGALGAAFWALVMWAGALPNGSAPVKKLMPIRGELSITAAVITLSHIITFGMNYISSLIKGRTGSDFLITSILSIAMVLIMIPLTVMSFKTVRKKMDARTWKKIQRAAYVFYALIYVHIMVLFVPKAQKGREGYFLSVLVYSAVFIGYAVMRVRKHYLAKKKSEGRILPNIICACAMIIPVSLAGVVSLSKDEKPETVVPVSENSAAVTTVAASVVTKTSSSTVKTAQNTTTATVTGTETASVTTTAVTVSTDKKNEEESALTTEAVTEDQHNESPAQEQREEAQPETDPPVAYKYRNGEYEAEAEGYDGKVHVKLTVENDTITNLSAWADDDDPEYFGDAKDTVVPQIISKASADGIDACSGATYSSKGIIEAARKAIEQALN